MLSLGELLDLAEASILAFEYPAGKPGGLTVNGKLNRRGAVVATGRKQALEES